MAKLVSLLLVALLGISLVATTVMAKETKYHLDGNAQKSAQEDVGKLSTTNHACFSVKNAVPSAFVSLLATMATKQCALVTTTGRPSVEDPNALDQLTFSFICT
ncbi:hypothetical protein DITRI_Ditri03aG0110800 [Diplodiscus trichospermus]